MMEYLGVGSGRCALLELGLLSKWTLYSPLSAILGTCLLTSFHELPQDALFSIVTREERSCRHVEPVFTTWHRTLNHELRIYAFMFFPSPIRMGILVSHSSSLFTAYGKLCTLARWWKKSAAFSRPPTLRNFYSLTHNLSRQTQVEGRHRTVPDGNA